MTAPQLTKEEETRQSLLKMFWECEEEGFIRFLHFQWLLRHTPIFDEPFGVRVRSAVAMVRAKRLVGYLTQEEKDKYGLKPENKDIHKGWFTDFGPGTQQLIKLRRS